MCGEFSVNSLEDFRISSPCNYLIQKLSFLQRRMLFYPLYINFFIFSNSSWSFSLHFVSVFLKCFPCSVALIISRISYLSISIMTVLFDPHDLVWFYAVVDSIWYQRCYTGDFCVFKYRMQCVLGKQLFLKFYPFVFVSGSITSDYVALLGLFWLTIRLFLRLLLLWDYADSPDL